MISFIMNMFLKNNYFNAKDENIETVSTNSSGYKYDSGSLSKIRDPGIASYELNNDCVIFYEIENQKHISQVIDVLFNRHLDFEKLIFSHCHYNNFLIQLINTIGNRCKDKVIIIEHLLSSDYTEKNNEFLLPNSKNIKIVFRNNKFKKDTVIRSGESIELNNDDIIDFVSCDSVSINITDQTTTNSIKKLKNIKFLENKVRINLFRDLSQEEIKIIFEFLDEFYHSNNIYFAKIDIPMRNEKTKEALANKLLKTSRNYYKELPFVLLINQTLLYEKSSIDIYKLSNYINVVAPGVIEFKDVKLNLETKIGKTQKNHFDILLDLYKSTKGLVLFNFAMKQPLLEIIIEEVIKNQEKTFAILGANRSTEQQNKKLKTQGVENNNIIVFDNEIIYKSLKGKTMNSLDRIQLHEKNIFAMIPMMLYLADHMIFNNIELHKLFFSQPVVDLLLNLLKLEMENIQFTSCQYTDMVGNNSYGLRFFKQVSKNTNLLFDKTPQESVLMVIRDYNLSAKLQNSHSKKNQKFNPIHPKIQAIQKKLQSGSESDKKSLEHINALHLNPQQPGKLKALIEGTTPPANMNTNSLIYEEIKQNFRTILNHWVIGYDHIKEIIVDQLLYYVQNGGMGTNQVLVLEGPPGNGKSRFAKAIAACMRYIDTGDMIGSCYSAGEEMEIIDGYLSTISMNQISDKAALFGFSQSYKDSNVGAVIEAIKTKKSAKVVLFDEIDKTDNSKDNIVESLLVLFEPSQRNSFVDTFLKEPVPLGTVFMLCTANDMSKIKTSALASRLQIVYIDVLSNDEFEQLGKNKYLEILKKFNLAEEKIKLSDEDVLESIKSIKGYVHSWTDTKSFRKFLYKVGKYRIRELENKLTRLVSSLVNDLKAIEASGEKTKPLLDYDYILKLFPELTDHESQYKDTSGYAMATLQDQAGAYIKVDVASTPGNKSDNQNNSNVLFLPVGNQQNEHSIMNYMHTMQTAISVILGNILSSGLMNSHRMRFSNSNFIVEPKTPYALTELLFLRGPAILSILSAVAKIPAYHLVLIGAVDVNNVVYVPENDSSIPHRVSSILNTENTHIKKLFLPSNLNESLKDKVQEIFEKWVWDNDLSTDETQENFVEIKYISSFDEIIKDFLQTQDE